MRRAAAIAAVFAGLGACQAQMGGGGPGAEGPSAEPEPVSAVVVGKRLLSANQPEMALSSFQRAVLEEGVTAEALVGIAVSYMRLGRRGEAVRFLHAAIDADPNSATARNNLGVVLFDLGDYAAAASELQRAYAITGGLDASIATNLAMAERARDDQEASKPRMDDADYVVIQYGHGVYRLEPRAPSAQPVEGETRS